MEASRLITADDVAPLARGCAVLGTGGGGDVASGALAARRAVEQYGGVPLIALGDLSPDDVILPLGMIGAPTVGHEMIHGDDQPALILREVERLLGRRPAAVMSSEIGGSNGVHPVGWAARLGLPLLDADAMGRAFPEVQMVSMHVAGLAPTVIVLADVVGNVTAVRPVDGAWAERIARAVCVAAGSSALMADYILRAAEARGALIEGTVSRAIALGRAVDGAADPLGALTAELGARNLLNGKITDLRRETTGGFARGAAVVTGVGGDRGRIITLEIQNENLVAVEDGRVLAMVPDLITVVDTQTASAVQTEGLRYGQRISVLAWPCDPLWRTPRGIEVAGPRAFGYDLDYVPVEDIP
ncbi:DUF917 domain-containing protein [Sinosporangium siamense]|nr:DUF917 domain-containing protein [Sinosporangium siamense]